MGRFTKGSMKNIISPALPTEWQHDVAKSIDNAFRTQLAKNNLGLSPISLVLAYMDWALHLAVSPGRQMLLAQRAVALSQQAMSPWQHEPAVNDDGESVRENDPRFSDPSWNQWPFNALKEGFKASDAWWRESTQVDGISSHHHHMVNFFTRQGLDALSPSNWAVTNPEVLKKGQDSMGQSWLKGYQSYAKDLLEYQNARANSDAGMLRPLDFEVGKDVALTPGKVVFRNHLIELIQYTPTTETVYPEPLLIVPSCIMKYYILDLSPHNSMVRYLVGQGHTVFIMSWRNPDASDRDLGMQDYLQTGVMEAMAAVKLHTGAPRIHAIGYCLGGTFLSIVAAALSRCNRQSQLQAPRRRHEDAACLDNLPELTTITLLAAQTEFSEPGQLGVFIDDDQLKTLREAMARTGYLSGRHRLGGGVPGPRDRDERHADEREHGDERDRTPVAQPAELERRGDREREPEDERERVIGGRDEPCDRDRRVAARRGPRSQGEAQRKREPEEHRAVEHAVQVDTGRCSPRTRRRPRRGP